MDLIVNRQLDCHEELVIYELTLKKQRSKKRTNVNEKHAAAMQQLADELIQQRKQQSGEPLIEHERISPRQLRLEQLNNELERRLHQYEYLVAQEKAILGAYNMNLFTNEGVNNFQDFELRQQRKLHASQSCYSLLQLSSKSVF